jgi:hypothetical protein
MGQESAMQFFLVIASWRGGDRHSFGSDLGTKTKIEAPKEKSKGAIAFPNQLF